MPSSDDFHDYLPILLSPRTVEETHTTAQLGRKNAARYTSATQVADQMTAAGRVAQGSKIVMFASSDLDNRHNRTELEENTGAAKRVARTLGSLGISNPIDIMPDYDRIQVEHALADVSVGHLMFFGHSKRSGVFVPGDPIIWRNTDPIDHLKKSVGVIGCGVYDRRGVTPRFGFNLVEGENGILYGTPDGDDVNGAVRPSQMSDLSNFSILPTRLLEDFDTSSRPTAAQQLDSSS